MRTRRLLFALLPLGLVCLAAAGADMKDAPDTKAGAKKDEGPKITAAELAGWWRYSPGVATQGILVRKDGTMAHWTSRHGPSSVDGRWAFDAAKQDFVFGSASTKRVFRAVREEGEIVLVGGRELWREGVNLNTPLPVGQGKLVRMTDEDRKAAEKRSKSGL